MSDPRVELLTAFRTGLAVIPLLTGIVVPRPVGAQQPVADVVSSSIIFTQPLTRGATGDLTQRVILDPSPHALAPWVTVGLRWAWDAAPDRDAHPIGAVGLRFQHQSLRVALGIGHDAAYSRIGGLGKSRSSSSPVPSPVPPSLPPNDSTCAAMDCSTPPICPDGLVLDSDKVLCMPPTPADSSAEVVRAGYAMQPVTDVTGSVAWSAGRVAVGVETGWRLGGPRSRRLWYSATVATPIAPMFALVAGVDRRYDRALSPGATRMTLGLQWRWALRGRRPPAEPVRTPDHAAPPTDSSSVGEGGLAVHRMPTGIRLSFVATGARQVELRSDLTGWTAVPMEHVGDGRWQLDLAAGPGVHQLAVRVDGGAWLPPPGFSAGSDGYGGAVGLFVVEP